MTLLTNFYGGKVTREYGFKTPPNSFESSSDVDISQGSLKSIKDYTVIGESKPYFYLWHSATVSFEDPTYFVEFQDTLFYLNNGSIKTLDKAGKEYEIGMPVPVQSPQYLNIGDLVIPEVGLGGSGEEGLFTGILKYRIAYMYNNKAVKYKDQELDLGSEKYSKITIYTKDINNYSIAIYREVSGVYRKIGDLPLYKGSSIKDASFEAKGIVFQEETVPEIYEATYVYTYYNKELDLESNPSPLSKPIENTSNESIILLVDTSNDPKVTSIRLYKSSVKAPLFNLVQEVPNDINELQVEMEDYPFFTFTQHVLVTNRGRPLIEFSGMALHGNRLFGFGENKLFFSNEAYLNYWGALDFLIFDSNITGLLSWSSGLLIFTLNETYLATEVSYGIFNVIMLSKDFGCVSQFSPQLILGIPIWESDGGLVSLMGNKVSYLLWGSIGETSLGVISSCTYRGAYYGVTSNSIIKVDFNLNGAFTEIYSNENIVGILYTDGSVYACNKIGSMLHLFSGKDRRFTVVTQLQALDMIIKYKKFSRIRFIGEGIVDFDAIVDGVITTSSHSIKLTKHSPVKEVVVSPSGSSGYSIQLAISCIGEIQAIYIEGE